MSGSHNEVRCRVALHDEMHRFDEIASEAEIAPHVDVAKIQLAVGQNWLAPFVQFACLGQAERSRGGGMGDLLRHETKRTPRTFVIEKYAA